MKLNEEQWKNIKALLITGGATLACAAFLRLHEGKRNYPYKDSAGVLTVCYGHTDSIGTYAPIEDRFYSDEECDYILMKDIDATQQCFDRTLTAPVSEGVRAALISFVFNIGCARFSQSTLLTKLNQKDTDAAADELNRWCISRGKVLQGLKDRRADEKILWRIS